MGMSNPESDGLEAIVAGLRDIPALVTLLEGDEDNIILYERNYEDGMSLNQVVYDQKPPTIIVAWQGTRTIRKGLGDSIAHDYSIYLRPNTSVSELFTTIREGVVVSKSLKFKLCSFANLTPPEDMSLKFIPTQMDSEQGEHDFAQIDFWLGERGADN